MQLVTYILIDADIHAYPMKTVIRLGAIAPITGCPVWYDGIRKPGMRIRVKPSFTYLATLSHP